MENYLIQLMREGMLLVLVVSAPPLLTSMLLGLIISIFQATTQIQEQTLTFVPKLVAVFGSLAVAGPWIGSQVIRFTHVVFEGIAHVM